MALRRGFKSEANWLARNVRDELGIASHLPLCPWRLAELLGFPVISLSEFADSELDAVIYLGSSKGQRDFSAITLFNGNSRMIIHNDGHQLDRQALRTSLPMACCCTLQSHLLTTGDRVIMTPSSRRRRTGWGRHYWCPKKPPITSPA
jgi:hypothetical protein